MNTKTRTLIVSALILSSCTPAPAQIREWTNPDGQIIRAEVIERPDQNTITIKREDGLIFTVQNDRFSDADQVFIRSLPVVKTFDDKELGEIFRAKFPKIKISAPLPLDYEPLARLQKEYEREFGNLRSDTYKVNLKVTLLKIKRSKEHYSVIANSDFRAPTKGFSGVYSGGSPAWKEGLAARAALVWLGELEKMIQTEYKVRVD
jgi:hypothetical protein